MENVKYFKYFDGIITKDVIYTSEIKSGIFTGKSAFKSKRKFFTRQLDLNLREALLAPLWAG
jgi:hypothetical protein